MSFVPEFATGAELDEITNYYASAYGSCAELVDPASNTYNCHGYAWIMSNGLTIEEVCRISQHNLAPYWNDFSYL